MLLNGARARPPHTAEQGTLVESIEQGDGYKGEHSDASQRRCRTRASVILVVQQRLVEYGGAWGAWGTRGGGQPEADGGQVVVVVVVGWVNTHTILRKKKTVSVYVL